MISEKAKKILKEKVKKLDKKDDYLIISDFDDTIFSRKQQLEDSELIKNNRWNIWNFVMRKIIWIDNIIKDFYLNKDFPKIITNKLRKNHDLILTAGYNDFQEAKIKACGLDYINYSIVPGWEEKILETINYIIHHLAFIPNKVTIYEDRPKYFTLYKDFLEDILWTEFEIIFVEMIDNYTEPKITKID